MKIQEKAAKGTHSTVIDLIKNKKPGKILDIAAGQGNISFQLEKMGFEVVQQI